MPFRPLSCTLNKIKQMVKITKKSQSQFVESLAFAAVGFCLIWNSQKQLSRT